MSGREVNQQTNRDIHFPQDSCNTLAFTWSSTTFTQYWNILVSQIECDSRWRPPDGCLQWYTGTEGTIYSYNYQGDLSDS